MGSVTRWTISFCYEHDTPSALVTGEYMEKKPYLQEKIIIILTGKEHNEKQNHIDRIEA